MVKIKSVSFLIPSIRKTLKDWSCIDCSEDYSKQGGWALTTLAEILHCMKKLWFTDSLVNWIDNKLNASKMSFHDVFQILKSTWSGGTLR